MKTIISILAVIVVVGIGYYVLTTQPAAQTPSEEDTATQEQGQIPTTEVTLIGEAGIAGNWKSMQDPNFTSEFTIAEGGTSGTVVYRYAGDENATLSGSWEVVEDVDAEPINAPEEALQGQTLIKMNFDEEMLYFVVAELTAENLMLYTPEGTGILAFERTE